MKDKTMEQMQENAITHMEGEFSQDEIYFTCAWFLFNGLFWGIAFDYFTRL